MQSPAEAERLMEMQRDSLLADYLDPDEEEDYDWYDPAEEEKWWRGDE